VKIVILCEGRTEDAFKRHLLEFLKPRLPGTMPKLVFDRHDGSIPTEGKLQRVVTRLLETGQRRADAVIALTDVYPEFSTAQQANEKLRAWVGDESRFHPHVALHDFEAWLLPYWDRILRLAGSNRAPFGEHPELVNHGNPPSRRLKQLFEAGRRRDSYNKPRDANRILDGADLLVSIQACTELKALVNTILQLSGGQPILDT